MNTIAPLLPGDLIYITCPAGHVSRDRIAFSVEALTQWGFRVEIGKTVGTGEYYFSGTDAARLADLQHALDRPDVRAVLAGRGGYGCSRIVDDIDFTGFLQYPKWLCGFSDITVLHSHLHAAYRHPSLHSPMCGAFTPESVNLPHLQYYLKALLGGALHYTVPPHPFNRGGTATGLLTGGNLAILAHLTGSASSADTTGKILFIEDIGEHLYHIDRMMLNLKRAGKLAQLAGLVAGSFTDTQDTERPFGQTLEELIGDKVAGYNYPVLYGLPCGHGKENVTLRLGAVHQLIVDAAGGSLSTAAL